MDINYKEEYKVFKQDLDNNNELLMSKEEDEFGICKQLSSLSINKPINNLFVNENIEDIFLNQISILGDTTKKYYQDHIPKIKVEKSYELKNGCAEIVGYPGKQKIYITKKAFTNLDFVAYSHELGHVPNLDNRLKKENEYFEYTEVLPIYFEYLASKTIKENNYQELFLNNRLLDTKQESKFYLNFHNKIKDKINLMSYKDKYYDALERNSYKYVKSFEYALQLINRAEEDQKIVNSSIDKYITGEESFKSLRKKLDIDTSGCKKLQEIISKK